MKVVVSTRWFRISVLLLAQSLVACSQPQTSVQNPYPTPVRVIISFDLPASDSQQLRANISDACLCNPVFIRPYTGDALIYQLPMPSGYTFTEFEQKLGMKAKKLGIKSFEQDRMQQHQ